MVATSVRARRATASSSGSSADQALSHCDQDLPLSSFYACTAAQGDGYSAYWWPCSIEPSTSAGGWSGAAPGSRPMTPAAAAGALTVTRYRSGSGWHGRVPAIPQLPPAPDFSRGLRTTMPGQSRAWWTSVEGLRGDDQARSAPMASAKAGRLAGSTAHVKGHARQVAGPAGPSNGQHFPTQPVTRA